MSKIIEIFPIDPSTAQLEELAVEARKLGHAFVDRLIQDARTGQNRFEKSGECFYGVFCDGMLVGCGGINQDPYTDQHVGRLRHIYVLANARREGLARMLVQELLNRSKVTFSTFRLRTSGEIADKFYDAMGFVRTDDENATHIIRVH